MIRQVLEKCRDFHEARDAQITFALAFSLLAFLALIGMIADTAMESSERVQLQNGADAVALSGAAWVARGMNVMSASNVMQSQFIGAAIILNALTDATEYTLPVVEVLKEVTCTCAQTGYGCIFCCIPCVIYTIEYVILEALDSVLPSVQEALSECGALFWIAVDGLDLINEVVDTTFYVVAAARADRAAVLNGADWGLFLPGPVFAGRIFDAGTWTLPPCRAEERQPLCRATRNGTEGDDRRGYHELIGYRKGEGPLKSGVRHTKSFTNLFIGSPYSIFFDALWRVQYAQVCEDQPFEPFTVTYEKRSYSLAECQANAGRSVWARAEIWTKWYPEPQADPMGLVELPQGGGGNPCEGAIDEECVRDPDCQANPGCEQELDLGNDPDVHRVVQSDQEKHECAWSPGPDFTRVAQNAYGKYDLILHLVDEDAVPEDPAPRPPPLVSGDWYQYKITYYILLYYEYEETQRVDENPLGGSGDDCDVPKPYILDPDICEDEDLESLRFFALVGRGGNEVSFLPGLFTAPENTYSYAQAAVYNGLSEDMFTQDWRIHLEPATLLEIDLGGLFSSGSLDSVPGAEGLLAEAQDYLNQLNNH